MAKFENAFSGMASERMVNSDELTRAMRQMVAAEFEAAQLYTQLAESTDNELAIAVLNDVAKEEMVHAGEFMRVLEVLSPDDQENYKEGAEEVEEIIQKLGIKAR